MMFPVFDIHFTLEWPQLGKNGQVYIEVPINVYYIYPTYTNCTSLLLNCNKNKQFFLQIFGLMAFIKQKEINNNDNLCKIHGGLYIAWALKSVYS